MDENRGHFLHYVPRALGGYIQLEAVLRNYFAFRPGQSAIIVAVPSNAEGGLHVALMVVDGDSIPKLPDSEIAEAVRRAAEQAEGLRS
jgi:hypothetical protein